MNWFQRYGIPGASFWSFLLLLIAAFYRDEFSNEKLEIVGLIAVITFLPIGYFIFLTQQLVYYSFARITKWGSISRAMELSKAVDFNDKKPRWELDFEIEECLMIANLHKKDNDGNSYIEKFNVISDWTRKRTDVSAINFSVILAILSSWFVAIILLPQCFNLSYQCNCPLLITACVASFILIIICFISAYCMHYQVIEVNKGMYLIFAGLRPCNLNFLAP